MTGAAEDRYERWVRSRAYRAERASKAEVILHLCRDRLAAAGRIGDLGAGTGLIKKTLEAQIGKPIVGFELDTSFVEARERMVVADACRLPVPDGAFDFLVLNHLYEHVRDQARLFEEAWRALRPGGAAYVSAGSRRAVLEPHYRLPFLSWLPRGTADRYVRWTGRGAGYGEIRFLDYRPLRRLMEAPGFRVRDLTERALSELLGEGRGAGWRPAWAVLARLPASLRRPLLHAASPQWFFLLEKDREGGKGRGEVGRGPTEGKGGR